jgi:hypothetical protein
VLDGSAMVEEKFDDVERTVENGDGEWSHVQRTFRVGVSGAG